MAAVNEMMVERARIFATAAHAATGQTRKYTGKPYIEHPKAVVALLRSVVGKYDSEMLAAAWLHDVVEDTEVSLSLIEHEFGIYVSVIVDGLTDVSRPEDGSRTARKQIDLLHTSHALPTAKTIKLADIIDNVSNVVERDPQFAKVYVPEKANLLSVLSDGNRELYDLACDKLKTAMYAINNLTE